jgi:AraC family transcriptional regulator
MTECPYCSLAKKSGELFCSRHGTDMQHLRSGLFYIKARKFEECDPHITRLSLNFNLDTTQPYFIGKKEYTVSQKKYLLINEGQAFSTFANAPCESRMVTIAFKVGLAETLHYNLTSADTQLLSDPEAHAPAPLHFLEQTYTMDNFLMENIPQLLEVSEKEHNEIEFQEQLERMLLHILSVQLNVKNNIDSISKVKASTRIEIYKRLQAGYDFILDNYNNAITIDEIASHACLSPFNFKRLFKDFYKQSPYQVIKSLRMERAIDLLKNGLPVNQVCKDSGWEDPSSFIRMFKKSMHMTPGEFQNA